MNSQQLKDFLDYVQKHNSWQSMISTQDEQTEKRKVIKYVRLNVDTRDGIAFGFDIVFSNIIRSKSRVSEEFFRVENEEDLKKVYAWLDEPV